MARFVVVKPVRTGIGNFGKNLTYPGRLINNLLQGKWSGARDESYQDYFEKFAIPYYQAPGVASPTAEALEKAGDLRTYDAGLGANPKIRIIVNQNDFLLADEDLAWLDATFGSEQLTVFKQGGHLGNPLNPRAQK